MIRRRDFDEIRDAARLEQQGDMAFQRRLVVLVREMIVRLPLHQIGGKCALGRQGIYRDVLVGDVASLSNGTAVPISLVRICSSLPAMGKVPTLFGRSSVSIHGRLRS